MRSYEVLVERQNGHFRALIPTLPNIVAEGATLDEAVVNAREMAQDYLLKVELATVQLMEQPQTVERFSKVEDLLAIAGLFRGDEEAMQQHIEEIYVERRRQREEVAQTLEAVGAVEVQQVSS